MMTICLFYAEAPTKENKTKKIVMVISDQRVSKKRNYQERNYNLHSLEKII